MCSQVCSSQCLLGKIIMLTNLIFGLIYLSVMYLNKVNTCPGTSIFVVEKWDTIFYCFNIAKTSMFFNSFMCVFFYIRVL